MQLDGVGERRRRCPDDAISAGIKAAASADYMDTVNTEIDTWVEDNEYDDYYDASRDVVGSNVANLDGDVARKRRGARQVARRMDGDGE